MQKRTKMLFLCSAILSLSLSAVAMGVSAGAEGAAPGGMETTPAFAVGKEENIRTQVSSKVEKLGAPKGKMTVAVSDKDRVLLQQDLQNGSVFMNEAEGVAFVVKDADLLSAWAADGVILTGEIEKGGDQYLLTDKNTLKKSAGEVAQYEFSVGKLPEEYNERVTKERMTDRFADAYKFAANYNADEYTLGLPLTNVEPKLYTTRDLQSNGKYDGTKTSEKTYFAQKFEGGYIIQARLLQCPHFAAAPISNDMYNKVVALPDNATLNITGAPVNRQFKIGNDIYQNFEFGYVKVSGGTAQFVVDKAVSPSGTEMSRIITSFEDNWGKQFNVENFSIEREQVRKNEEVLEAVGSIIESGIVPYKEPDDINKQGIGWPMHEFAGKGAMLKMNSPDCGKLVGGNNLFVICNNWYEEVGIINNKDFTPEGAYFTEKENRYDNNTKKFIGPGFPLGGLKTINNIKYQEYTNGVIYQGKNDANYTCIKGDDFVQWMEGNASVEEALAGMKFRPYKHLNYMKGVGNVVIYYDNPEETFKVDGKLYTLWMGENGSFENACKVNGVPVFATDQYLLTTKYCYTISGDNAVQTDGLGKVNLEPSQNVFGTRAYTAQVQNVVTDGFADAYLFAMTRNHHNLGIPTALAETASFVDTLGGGDTVHYIKQTFENGVIIQSSYDNPAVAIFGNVLEEFNKRGAEQVGLPIARQYTVDGTTYCNFTFGYMKLAEGKEGEFVFDKAVGFKGNEIDRNIGRFENRDNVAKAGADFEHELLRIYEAYVQEYERVADTGYKLFTGSVPLGHEWNAYGLTQSYIAGSSTSNAWGQQKLTVMVMKTPYEKVYIVRNAILDKYAQLGGNNVKGNYGMPTGDDFTVTLKVLDKGGTEVDCPVTFQNFERGVVYSYVNIDIVIVASLENCVAKEDGSVVNASGEVQDLKIEIAVETPDEPDDTDPTDPDDTTPDDSEGKPTPSEPEQPQEEEKGGCHSSVGAGMGAFALLATAFSAVGIMFARRKNK